MNKIAIMIISLIISGCAVKPEVTYKRIDPNSPPLDTSLTDSFYLASSTIEVQPTNEMMVDPNNKKTKIPKYKLNIFQADYTSFKIGVISHDSIWSKTRLSIAKSENSDRVKDIGIETTDNRVQTIKDIASIAISLIPIAAILRNDSITTSSIDGQAKKEITNQIQIADIIQAGKVKKTINISDSTSATVFLSKTQPLTSFSANKLSEPETLTSLKNLYIYSSCTDADIFIDTIIDSNHAIRQEFKARVNDPRYIQYVAFPYKGKITAHSQCGVSVATDASSPSSDAAVIAALLTEIKNIKTEIDKTKK